ncbi:hypothetical protein NRB56_22340 [Nocardia sp. RB56]|uniref:Uncharacterized protein n=1 Tax=Nocardia aurantia TaxID=2585199 RepID=A0A7K0DLL8_9NOCA|nr:hypothetical protein [Nocardia aurantia]
MALPQLTRLDGAAKEIVRDDVTADELMALVAGAFAAIHHAGAETDPAHLARIARISLDGLLPQPRSFVVPQHIETANDGFVSLNRRQAVQAGQPRSRDNQPGVSKRMDEAPTSVTRCASSFSSSVAPIFRFH